MKRLLLYLAVLILPLLSGCAANPKVATFNQVTYRYQSSNGDDLIYRSEAGQILQVETTEQGSRVTANGQVYIVSGTANDLKVVLPGGVEVSRHYDASSSYGGAAPGAVISSEDWDRVDELRTIIYGPRGGQSNVSVWRYPIGLLLIALGILQVVNPRLAWQISEGWKYSNVEPSDTYLTLSRLSGVVIVLAGIFVLFGAV